MKRVVVTGLAAATPIGNIWTRKDQAVVLQALLEGKVGIAADPDFVSAGFKSTCSGRVHGLRERLAELVANDKAAFKYTKRFLGKGDTLALALLPAIAAVEDAGLTDIVTDNDQVAVFVGTGGPSTIDQCVACEVIANGESPRSKKLGPYVVTPNMSSGASAIISTHLKTRGGALTLTSACATGTHNIGFAFEQIALGKRTLALAGGADDCHTTKAIGFEAMRSALFSGDLPPEKASRPFDVDRGGFVDAAGGGVLVLEELDHALERGAHIYAEIVGASYTSDGVDMVAPGGEGAVRAMREALAMAGNPKVDYVNAHGTSTPRGDPVEMWALNEVFGADKPIVTSTKAQVGHSLGGAGAVEVVFTILMMLEGAVGPQVNLENLDPEIAELGWAPYIPTEELDMIVNYAMSNSFGFGGTNGVLVLKLWDE